VRIGTLRAIGAAGLIMSLLAGCGPQYAIDVLYPHPAQIPLRGQIRALAVYPFAAADGADPAWASVADRALADALDPDDPRHGWEQVAGPDRLRRLVAGRADNEQAVLSAARTAGAQALVTAVVDAGSHETRRESPDGSAPSVRRTATVRIDFRLTDTASGATLATRTIRRRYDSAAPAAELLDTDRAVASLIDRCAADFASMLASYEMRVTIPLRRCKTETAAFGNRLAADGAFSQALAVYGRSLDRHPDDTAAVFNAAAMHEAMGQLDAALRRYDQAYRMEPRREFAVARERVRLRLQREY